MSVLLRKIWHGYEFLVYELTDERTRDYWPGPISVASIITAYFYFCINIGPRLMKDVEPFKLKKTLLVFNAFQIIISAYLFYEGMSVVWTYNWACQPVDYSDSDYSRRAISATWLYNKIKITELLDTVFFVLRKKSRQISGLHLYHHASMLSVTWVAVAYYPNGHSTVLGVINCFVHVIMYSYYFIAGLGPKYQKYLWWKKHVTSLQLIQFLIIFVHNTVPLFIDCQYPRWINALLSVNSLHFVYMFGSFYYENYIKNKKSKDQNL